MRIYRFLIAGTLLALVGCGKKAPDVKVAPNADERKDTSQKASPKEHTIPEKIAFHPLDLRRYGIEGAIDVPEGAKVTAADIPGQLIGGVPKVIITHGKWFQLTISKAAGAIADEKAEMSRIHPGCVFAVDEPDAIVVESPTLPAGRILLRIKLEGREFQISNDLMTERVSNEALARILESARSLRMTEAVKQAIAKEKESLTKLKKLGYKCQRPYFLTHCRNLGWKVTISAAAYDDNTLGLLKDLSWVEYIVIMKDVPITTKGMRTIAEIPEVNYLDAHCVNMNDELLSSIGKMTSLIRLGVQSRNITDAGLAALASLTRLKTLFLLVDGTSSTITGAGLTCLEGMTELQDLRLGGLPITDEGLLHIGKCPTLQDLDIKHTQVTDKGLGHLKDLSRLRQMNLRETSITNRAISQLSRLKELKVLDLSHTAITGQGLRYFRTGGIKLDQLNVSRTFLNDEGLAELKGASVKNLIASNTSITDAGLAALVGNSSIEILDIGDNSITDAGLIHLGKIPGLQVLELDGTAITGSELPQLKSCSGLRILSLDNTPLTDAGLSKLPVLPKLEILELGSTNVSDASLPLSKNYPQLTRLGAKNTRVTEKGANTFKAGHANVSVEYGARKSVLPPGDLKNLQQLDFKPTDNVEASNLTKMPELDELSIGGKINNQGLIYLKGVKFLKRLTISGQAVSDLGLAHIAGLRELDRLNIEKCRISDAGLVHLKGLKKLMELHLPGKYLTDEGISQIKDIDHLAKLFMSDAKITDRGLQYLGQMRDLDTLIIPGCKITDAGLTAFQNCEELRTLDFGNTAVTGKGFAALDESKIISINLTGSKANDAGISGINQLKNLQTLQLSQTKVTDAGVAKLKKHPALTNLDLDGDAKVTDLALESIRMMPKLESVSVRKTAVTAQGVAAFQKARPDVKISFNE